MQEERRTAISSNTRLGVFFGHKKSRDRHYARFEFYLGSPGELIQPRTISGITPHHTEYVVFGPGFQLHPVKTQTVPLAYRAPLQQHASSSPTGRVGHVTAVIQNGRVMLRMYFPKDNLTIPVPRLGYFLESLVLTHLKKNLAVTHISSNVESSIDRERQLRAVGLELGVDYPINTWLRRLGAGIRKQTQAT